MFIIKNMCQTVLISQNMVRMSRRTYNHRLEIASHNMYSVNQLARLNRDLDRLYEFLYAQWRTVTKEDYSVFGGQFKILLETIKGLYNSCREAPKEMGLKEETRKLGMNYSALYELNSDIVAFSVNAAKHEDLKNVLAQAGQVMKNL